MNNSENNSGFIAGTLIHTETGLKPIEQIQVGDFVLSKSETGEQAYKCVLQTFTHPPKRFIQVNYSFDDARDIAYPINTTMNHPFWVIDKGWTLAEDLNCFSPKNKLELCDNRQVTLEAKNDVYVSEQPGVGWTPCHTDDTSQPGDLWDFVNHRLVATRVPALEKIQYNRYFDPSYRHHHTHFLKLPVYNLEVEDFHTYYVGKHGVWVHNQSYRSK